MNGIQVRDARLDDGDLVTFGRSVSAIASARIDAGAGGSA